MRQMIWAWMALAGLARADVWISSPETDISSTTWQPILLQASSDPYDPELSVSWHISSGQTLEGNNALFTPPGPGVFTVTMRAQGETDTRKLYVNQPTPQWAVGAPVIQVILPERDILHPGEHIEIRADFVDPDWTAPYTLHWFYLDDRQPQRREGDVLDFSVASASQDPIAVSLIVTDGDGYHSMHQAADIFVLTGNLPPSGRIVRPVRPRVTLPVGTRLDFRAEGFDAEGDLPLVFRWTFEDGQEVTGASVSRTFSQEGDFVVLLATTDARGNADPSPKSRIVSVVPADAFPLPFAIISLPNQSARIFAGESLILGGSAYHDGTLLDGVWTVTDLISGEEVLTRRGNYPGRIVLETPGFYQIALDAVSPSGARTPRDDGNTRYVAVQERLEDLPPRLSVSGDIARYVPNHTSVDFVFEGMDPEMTDLTYFWVQDAQYVGMGDSVLSVDYDLPADAFDRGFVWRFVEVFARDQAGNFTTGPFRQQAIVYQDRFPLIPHISDDANGATLNLPVGSQFVPTPSVEHAEGLELTYFWSASNLTTSQQVLFSQEFDPGPIPLNEVGLVAVTFFAEAADASIASAPNAFLWIQVYDPERAPHTTITKPVDDRVTVEVGTTLDVEGVAAEPNFQRVEEDFLGYQRVTNQLTWRVVAPDGSSRTSRTNDRVRIGFQTVGLHTVILETENILGLSDPDPDRLTVDVVDVRQADDFEPNDTRATAAELELGTYTALSVDDADPVDWYALDLEVSGTALEFDLDLRQATRVVNLEVYWGSTLIQHETLLGGRRHPFTLWGVSAGMYYIKLELVPSDKRQRDGLSFGIGLSTSHPRLTFCYPKEDSVDTTFLTVVNPFETAAEIVFEARDDQGDQISEVYFALPPMGRIEKSITRIFNDIDPASISWVRVRSDQSVVGLGFTVSRDMQTAIAEPALVGNLDELVVPHIAQNTQQWFTLAAVANNASEASATVFDTAGGNFAVGRVDQPYGHALFDFLDLFGGSLPQGTQWGTFLEQSDLPNLAGMEIFGKRDGNLQIAALNLSSEKLKNPNFIYVRKNIAFPHVAADTANFWTGIAFVNTQETPTNVVLFAYDVGGNVLAQSAIEIEPRGKRVGLAPDFFPELAETVPISWIYLQTDGSVQGYELFGSNDGTDRRLAGFPAVAGGATELVFAKIWVEDQRFWTGLAAVNLSEDQANHVVYSAYDDDGNLLGTATSDIGPRQKDVALVEHLFGGQLPVGCSWLKLKATQPIAAFILWGDIQGNFLAGAMGQ